jgi:CheY-like chemotaxis protein
MRRTILIVEDDEPTLLLLVAVMRRSGLTTITARNGKDAIELVESRGDIGCIILDLMMPEVDGKAVIAHMAGARIPIPVIVCSAALPKTTTDFDTDVVRAVVRKPFDIEQLISTVGEVLDSSDRALP